MKREIFIPLIIAIIIGSCSGDKDVADYLKPYSKNPAYWQYKGEPVFLLGASDNHNLFQVKDMKEQMMKMIESGGNYVRNTISFREPGDAVPFYMNEEGKYDLERWDDDFWQRFDKFLKLANQYDVIVHIEVWDRFDYSIRFWHKNPYNPGNNINYTFEETLFDTIYSSPPEQDKQPFFHSIPGMPMYHEGLDIVRKYQEKFVARLLDYTLEYNNILYVMNNETTTPVAWGNHWMDFIDREAGSRGKVVFTTDMFDHFFEPQVCEECQDAIHDPVRYPFLEISQVNSRVTGEDHWNNLQWILNERDKGLVRPANCIKIYGAVNPDMWWGFNEAHDAIERFYRNIVGGVASARHHRRPHGQGQSEEALASLRAVRKAETLVRMWDITPAMELITERLPNEAYIAADPGNSYLLYFPSEGTIMLDLMAYDIEFNMHWINAFNGEWGDKYNINGGKKVEIITPDDSGWLLVIKNQNI